MHDLTLMDFSLGGLGWLLENQLMWNNLVPLGGELHQLRGNPHYGMRRIEESTISSWLTYISQFKMCQLCDLKRKCPICCLIMNSLPLSLYSVVSAASLLTVALFHLSSHCLMSPIAIFLLTRRHILDKIFRTIKSAPRYMKSHKCAHRLLNIRVRMHGVY